MREYEDPSGGVGEINDFYGLGTREADEACWREDARSWDIGNLWGETRIHRPLVGGQGVPFARDGGNSQLFLDYRTDPPCVSRLISSTHRTCKITGSFAEFVDMLRPVSE